MIDKRTIFWQSAVPFFSFKNKKKEFLILFCPEFVFFIATTKKMPKLES